MRAHSAGQKRGAKFTKGVYLLDACNLPNQVIIPRSKLVIDFRRVFF